MEKEFNYPPVVYKYRSWTNANHQNMLRKNELYLSSPADFNDPFDCRIPENFLLLDTREKIDEYIQGFMERNTDAMLNAGKDPKKEVEFLKDELTNHVDRFQAHNEKMNFKRQDDHYGVLSLSGKWDSILMWSHYGDNHRGYCVGFHEESIRNSKLFGRGGNVMSSTDDNFPAIDPRNQNFQEKAILQTHFKSKDWQYEEEYRLTSLLFPGIPTIADRKRHVPNEFIAEVILGIQTPENHQKEIIALAVEKGIPVYQALRVPFKFKIDRMRID